MPKWAQSLAPAMLLRLLMSLVMGKAWAGFVKAWAGFVNDPAQGLEKLR